MSSSFSPEFPVLGLLAIQPGHGYELYQRLTTELGQSWHVSMSQLYNILNRLEAEGLIRGTVQAQDSGPSRRRFRLTGAGRRHFQAWLHQPSGNSARAIRLEFITRLYFARALEPEALSPLIDAQIEETRASLVRLQNTLHELPPEQVFNRLGLELRVRQLTSIMNWLADCSSRIVPSQDESAISHPTGISWHSDR